MSILAVIGHALLIALLSSWALVLAFYAMLAVIPQRSAQPKRPFDALMEARSIVWAHAREWVA